MAKMHSYPVAVAWQGGRDGQGTIETGRTGQSVRIAAPPEFGGTGSVAATNPEELLASAVAGCYAITFGVVAAHRRLPVVRVELEGVGAVEEDGPRFTYKAIALRPRIIVAPDATDAQVEQTLALARKADHYCLVTNAVRSSVEISVDPEVVRDVPALV
jgi:peroxiredoxin-like protein